MLTRWRAIYRRFGIRMLRMRRNAGRRHRAAVPRHQPLQEPL